MSDATSGLIRQAHWSDAFFNYVPAEQAFGRNVDMRSSQHPELLEAATQFLSVYECPYDADWLVREFLRRV